MAVPFLPPTKLQLRILDHFVEEQGYGSGVHKLYRRLKVLFDGLIHPAMDDEGNVAYGPLRGRRRILIGLGVEGFHRLQINLEHVPLAKMPFHAFPIWVY